MDTVELNGYEDSSNDTYMEHSLPLVDSMECDYFGEQEIFPRIGEDYQVGIPELVEKSAYLSQENNPTEAESSILKFLMGLPIPVIFVDQDNGDLSWQTAEGLDKLQLQSNVGEPAKLLNFHTTVENRHPEFNGLVSREVAEVAFAKRSSQYEGPGYLLVPGSASQCWSYVEMESFLLGLYIFGKNLIQLKKFLVSKRMEDIQSYYYGKFYRIQEYFRWSECRKMRSRKCVVGHKLFTGLRLQELLSRILPVVSDESKTAVQEVSKIYVDGEMAFEEFVFSLKSLVGMNILVEAVGIGKGKQDITGMLEPSKSNQGIPTRPEIPIGKACSSLTCSEIVKYLTGDYRLSKARSNDLFWEAVWPRLLARGWHSEVPKDQAYAAGSKNALVFLVPGIKKFSRRKLKRGDHYFDSVSDVLNKVASEPGSLELDNEEDKSQKNGEEHEWNHEKSEEDDVPTQRQHCYLQPRILNRITDGMKFTVVDTSLSEGKPYKIRELRCLPVDIYNSFKSTSAIEIFCRDAPGSSSDESDHDDVKLPSSGENYNAKGLSTFLNGEVHDDVKTLELSNIKQEIYDAYPNSESIPENDNTKSKHYSEDKKLKRVRKCKLGRSMKEDNSENVAPVTKRRRGFTACNRRETSNVESATSVVPAVVGPEFHSNVMMDPSEMPVKSECEMPSCGPAVHDLLESIPSSDVSYHDKLSLTSSSRSSPTNSIGRASVGNFHVMVEPQEAPHVQSMIDLNLPPDFDTAPSLTQEARDKDDGPGCIDASHTSQDVTCSEQQSYMNPQRRSTRNRPPTTRALEALANGFLTVNSRPKGKEGRSRHKSTSRTSQRALGGIELSEFQNNLVAPLIVQESQSGESSDSNRSEIRESRVLPEENGPPIIGP